MGNGNLLIQQIPINTKKVLAQNAKENSQFIRRIRLNVY